MHPKKNNVIGRMRWTTSHELAHVSLEHFKRFSHFDSQIAENDFIFHKNPYIESEADLFAAILLCPFPICDYLHISSVNDIHTTFGLSFEASCNRWNDYLKWKKHHIETNWDKQIIKLFKQKTI